MMCRSQQEAERYLAAVQPIFATVLYLPLNELAHFIKNNPVVNGLTNDHKDKPDHWAFYAVIYGCSDRSCIYLSW